MANKPNTSVTRTFCSMVHLGAIFLIYCLVTEKNGTEVIVYSWAVAFATYVWYDGLSWIVISKLEVILGSCFLVMVSTAALWHQHLLNDTTIGPFVGMNALCTSIVVMMRYKTPNKKG